VELKSSICKMPNFTISIRDHCGCMDAIDTLIPKVCEYSLLFTQLCGETAYSLHGTRWRIDTVLL